MIHYDEDNIQFFEKKYSIEEIVQLYKANRLLFVRPRTYGYSQIYYDNNTTQLIKAIDMGMPFPPVYASEQQNGDMVTLEIDDKLYRFETEQNEENSQILRDDEVVIIIQTIDNHDFFDIRKLEDE